MKPFNYMSFLLVVSKAFSFHRVTLSDCFLCMTCMSGKKPLRNRVETVSDSLSNCVFVLMIDFMIICMCMYCMCFTGIETVPPDLLSVTGSCIKLRMTQQPPLHCIRSSKDPSVSFLTNFYSVNIVLTILTVHNHTCAQWTRSLSKFHRWERKHMWKLIRDGSICMWSATPEQ